MMEIKINHISEPVCQLYNGEGVLVGTITSALQMNDVRVQIYRQKLSGYYFLWNGKKIPISDIGRIDTPKGFYDTWDIQINTLIGLYDYNHKQP